MLHLPLGDGMPRIAAAQGEFEQSAGHRMLAPVFAVDLGVERAGEIQTVTEQRTPEPQDEEPRGPAHDDDPVRFLLAQHAEDARQRREHLRHASGVEIPRIAQPHALQHLSVGLARVAAGDDHLVSAPGQFARQQRDLQFRAARSAR